MAKDEIKKRPKQGLGVGELSNEVLRSIYLARKNGYTWSDIEFSKGLKPNHGMSAKRAYEKYVLRLVSSGKGTKEDMVLVENIRKRKK